MNPRAMYAELMIVILMFTVFSCMPKVIPPPDQQRSILVNVQAEDAYRAVKPALMKNGYQITGRDITVGLTKAKKINHNKHLIITVKSKPPEGTVVKIKLIVRKNGKPISVPEKTMTEVDTILQQIKLMAEK